MIPYLPVLLIGTVAALLALITTREKDDDPNPDKHDDSGSSGGNTGKQDNAADKTTRSGRVATPKKKEKPNVRMVTNELGEGPNGSSGNDPSGELDTTTGDRKTATLMEGDDHELLGEKHSDAGGNDSSGDVSVEPNSGT